ncbi:putative membrane protein YeaQ/YmgE (transglycosylase-associated protein family) [Catenulispora sp. GP43]|uniref:hypothetical protein n=1 Tax=Catenulispora sp. GP43 TaxID=3156263 RepID=UPI003512A997
MSFFTLLWLAALGLGIGALGRAVVKDGTPMATWMTAIVGVVGAVGGGSIIHTILGNGHTVVATLLGAALAALLVLAITSWQRTRGEGS